VNSRAYRPGRSRSAGGAMSEIDPIRDGRHYDALKAQDDTAFYREQARTASGPVLEIGCGTGRVTIQLAAAGVDVTGLDISASMLKEAKRKAREQGLGLDWIEADGRYFDLGRDFALVIMPFNTLQFFRDALSLAQVFDRVTRHLRPDGWFTFDVFNPKLAYLAADPSQRYERARYPDPHGGGDVILEEVREYLADRQVIRSTRYYHIGGRRDASIRTLELRCFFPCELDLLLKHHGFKIVSKYGDFDYSPFSGDAPKQICVCHRAEDEG
jgi:SAM-dependent methyltransferase